MRATSDLLHFEVVVSVNNLCRIKYAKVVDGLNT